MQRPKGIADTQFRGNDEASAWEYKHKRPVPTYHSKLTLAGLSPHYRNANTKSQTPHFMGNDKG